MELDLAALFSALGRLLPAKADPVLALRRQVEEMKLRQELGQLLPNASPIEGREILAERRDLVVIGQRGAGKTLTAFALALKSGRPVIAVDWCGELPDGVMVCDQRTAPRQQGACLVYDEAALRVGVGKQSMALWEIMALARQRDQCIVWTSQSSAAVDLMVYRQGVTTIWLQGDSRFERAEYEPEATAARHLLEHLAGNARGAYAVCLDGAWRVGKEDPPPGWSHRVSTAWASQRE